MGHIILGGLQGQKDRRLVGLRKARPLGHDWPEQVQHALGQPAHRQHRDQSARRDPRVLERRGIRGGQGALRGNQSDG